jgi:hypothetical protein
MNALVPVSIPRGLTAIGQNRCRLTFAALSDMSDIRRSSAAIRARNSDAAKAKALCSSFIRL